MMPLAHFKVGMAVIKTHIVSPLAVLIRRTRTVNPWRIQFNNKNEAAAAVAKKAGHAVAKLLQFLFIAEIICLGAEEHHSAHNHSHR